ncbi:hypothetical protein JYU34_001794 [Plutella xylostella]|uniref:Mutant cadherin n=1 Tax=Plutella xylostella TaxID=51655 RepID=A0ABQ7R4W3_PLUXY|nr:hypothetical protein JYU34_001794 [Plutella xylostella]
MSNTAKCNNCNVIIDELLTFVQNKIKIVDDVSLVQVCKSGFSESDIERSKTILIECIANTSYAGRIKMRRGTGKEQRDIEDIIRGLKQVEPSELPIFAARNLTKLPPYTFDHIDVTSLLKDIAYLKADLQDLRCKTCPTEEVQKLRNEMLELIRQEKPTHSNVNSHRGANFLDSGPVGLDMTLYQDTNDALPELESTTNADAQVSSPINPSGKHITIKHISVQECNPKPPTPPAQTGASTKLDTKSSTEPDAVTKPAQKPSLTFAQVSKTPKKSSVEQEKNETNTWTAVTYKKKRRNNNIRGSSTNVSTNKLKAAPRIAYIYLSNVDSSIKNKDIHEYAKDLGQDILDVEKLSEDHHGSASSYILKVRYEQLSNLLKSSFWPSNIIVGRYYNSKPLQVKPLTKNG